MGRLEMIRMELLVMPSVTRYGFPVNCGLVEWNSWRNPGMRKTTIIGDTRNKEITSSRLPSDHFVGNLVMKPGT